MFKTACYRFGSVILILSFIFFFGCGGSESGLDGGDTLVVTGITVHDNGDKASTPSKDIDVLQGECGEDDPPPEGTEPPPEGTEPPPEGTPVIDSVQAEKKTPEPFYNTIGVATLEYVFYCPTCPEGADQTYIIDSYTVEYKPIKTPDGYGDIYPSVKLNNLDQRIGTRVVFSRNSTTAEIEFTLVPYGTKAEYVKKSIAAGTSLEFIYDIKVTFFGRDSSGHSFSIDGLADVRFGNYNNCSSK